MDYFTLMVIFLTITVFSTIILGLISLQQELRHDYLTIWLSAFLIKTLGLSLLVANRYLVWSLFIFLSNILIALSALILIYGVAKALKSRVHGVVGILYAIFILVFAFYTFIVPDIDVRIGIISIITITNYVTLLWVVSKRNRLEIDIVYIRPIQLT